MSINPAVKLSHIFKSNFTNQFVELKWNDGMFMLIAYKIIHIRQQISILQIHSNYHTSPKKNVENTT